MSARPQRDRRRRWLVPIQAVVAAYMLLLAAGPLDHHDVACHLKSGTHCTTCVYASVAGAEVGSGADVAPRSACDVVGPERHDIAAAALASKPGDRSPPAA